MLSFENQLPEWKNTGTEPSENLKTNGFQGGYRPPASVFNWFWSKVIKAITELQETFTGHTHAQSEVTGLETTLSGKANASDLSGHTSNKSNPHGVTAAQVGAVPTSRTVNGKALSADITLSVADVGAAASSHNHDAGNITSGTMAAERLPSGNATTQGAVIVDDTMKWYSTNPVQNMVVANYIDEHLKLSGLYPMTGNLVIQPTSTNSPMITLAGNANDSGYRARTYLSKGANSSVDTGTELKDATFDGTYTSLEIRTNASYLSKKILLDDNGTDYELYGEHNKPTALDIDGVTNNTSASGSLSPSTNLITMSTLRYAINRTTSVAVSDSNYTTYMARGTALRSVESTPSYNGQISWCYE